MLAPDHENFATELWRSRAREAALSFAGWVARLGGEVDFLPPRPAGDRIVDGHVDPRDLVQQLKRRLDDGFGERFEYCPQRVEHFSSISDTDLVITSGAWSSQLGGLPAVAPVKGYLHSWEHVPAGSLREVLHNGPTYVFQRVRGTVIAGSTEEQAGFDPSIDWNKLRDLRARAGELYAPLRGEAPRQSWWGFRPATPTGEPVLEVRRAAGRKLVLAYGHYRNGILLADWTARWIADQFQ
jgi:glycine/D-amino acid oxidase-like deaminating enzyme